MTTENQPTAAKSSSSKSPRWFGVALAPGAPPDIRAAALQRVASVLRSCRGKIVDTAHALDVDRRTLHVWIQKHPELQAARDEAREIRL